MYHLDLQRLLRQAPLDRPAEQGLHFILAEQPESNDEDDAVFEDDYVEKYVNSFNEREDKTRDGLGRDGRVQFPFSASSEATSQGAVALAQLVLDASVLMPLSGAPACSTP